MDHARVAVRPIAADARVATAIGRHARLELVFECRGGRTVLASAYAEPPFRVGQTFAEGDGLHMIMASSAPGIFGGDVLRQLIRVEPGARVRLTSQSAVQVHPTADGATASVATRCEVAAGGALRCEWDPLIPFAGATLDQRIDLHVQDGGRLLWSDAFMGGRLARGECWAFTEVSHCLRLFRGDALAYLERYRLNPEVAPPTHPWVLGSAGYFGTVVALGPEMSHDEAVTLHQEMGVERGVRAAVTRLPSDVTIVRMLGDDGVGFHAARLRASGAFPALVTDHSDICVAPRSPSDDRVPL